MKLKDKVAIVTGGGGGIGKDIALTMAAEGAAVVVAAGNLKRLDEVAAEIEARGGTARAIQTDISDEAQVKKLVAGAVKAFGQLDILVNNSAAEPRQATPVSETDLKDWNDTLAVNLTGAMLCSREALQQQMIPRRSGSIVNISSVAGISAQPMLAAYSASKWGLIGLTETTSAEVGQYGIRVNAISPAATRTDRFMGGVSHWASELGITPEQMMEKITIAYSLRRIAEPSEIASVAAFLASDEASAVTGQNLVVSCGFHLLQPNEIV